jgi:hypothetical protein
VSTRSKVSLELVGEFPKVRTQVDRDLTSVSRADQRIGLNKDLGRHKYRCSTSPKEYSQGIESTERCVLSPSLAMVQGHNSIVQDEDGKDLADSGLS